MRIPKKEGDPRQTLGFFPTRKLLVLLDRDDYCSAVLSSPKGQFEDIKTAWFGAIQNDIASFRRFLRYRVAELE